MRDEHTELMWRNFIHLGEMIGDGDHEKWVEVEYRRLLKVVCPPTKEEKQAKTEIRRKKNENINKQIEERLKTDSCSKCNSKLNQTRSGSAVVICINEECKARFKYSKKKK